MTHMSQEQYNMNGQTDAVTVPRRGQSCTDSTYSERNGSLFLLPRTGTRMAIPYIWNNRFFSELRFRTFVTRNVRVNFETVFFANTSILCNVMQTLQSICNVWNNSTETKINIYDY